MSKKILFPENFWIKSQNFKYFSVSRIRHFYNSSKDDDFWWQAKNMDTEASGLIPR